MPFIQLIIISRYSNCKRLVVLMITQTAKRQFSRSYMITSGLYVPGNQERMLNKCVTTKATLLVPDMEDSVPPHEKPKAREMIRDKLTFLRENAFNKEVVITPRVNDLSTGLFHHDVEGILTEETVKLIDGICVPKVDRVSDVVEIDQFLTEQEAKFGLPLDTFKVIPQIESTLSLVNCKEILSAGQDRFIAAAFGADDFTADFEVYRSESDKELDFARKWFALCCHAYGIISIDTPYVQFKNPEGLDEQLAYLKTIGMKAKFAIHPTQVDQINGAFSPTKEEIEYYGRMVAEFEKAQIEDGKAAITFENKMVDIAAFRRAKALLKRAALLGLV